MSWVVRWEFYSYANQAETSWPWGFATPQSCVLLPPSRILAMRCNYPPAFRVGWPAFDMREAGFVGFCVCLWPGFDYGTQMFKNKAPITFRCFWAELWSRHRLEEMCYWLRIQQISHTPLVDPAGFEPATFGLWVRYSDLLSYGSERNVVLTNFAPMNLCYVILSCDCCADAVTMLWKPACGLVGIARFELATTCSQSKYATSYTKSLSSPTALTSGETLVTNEKNYFTTTNIQFWRNVAGSNCRPSACKADALPLSYRSVFSRLSRVVRKEWNLLNNSN